MKTAENTICPTKVAGNLSKSHQNFVETCRFWGWFEGKAKISRYHEFLLWNAVWPRESCWKCILSSSAVDHFFFIFQSYY